MHRALATSAFALILGAGPLLADITPDEVWQNLRESYVKNGLNVTIGSEDHSGEALNLSNVTLSDNAKSTLTIPRISLTPTGDGGVKTVLDGQIHADMRVDPTHEGLTLEIDLPGNQMTTTGTLDNLSHQMKYPSVVVKVLPNALGADSGAKGDITLTLSDLSDTHTQKRAQDGTISSTSELMLKQLALIADVQTPAQNPAQNAQNKDGATSNQTDPTATPEPQESEPKKSDLPVDLVSLKLTMSDLTLNGQWVVPAEPLNPETSLAQMISAGVALAGETHSKTTMFSFDTSFTNPKGELETVKGDLETADSGFEFVLGKDGMSYMGDIANMAGTMIASEIPVPLSLNTKNYHVSSQVPLLAGDQPQPFSIATTLSELSLGKDIWAALDPQTILPHDPINLDLDLTGTALLSANLGDPAPKDPATPKSDSPESTAPDMAALPFQPRSLTLKNFSLDAIGAALNATGELSFADRADQPTGTISAKASGVEALLQNAIKLGLISEENLIAPRMMMSIFARPVPGQTDQLETKLELREGGAIFANGQQIK